MYLPSAIAVPTLDFDKPSYTPFDRVTITLADPNYNNDSQKIESVEVTLTGTSSSQKLTLKETSSNTGIFVESIRFSPDLSKFPGDMLVRRDDGVTVSFRVDADNIIIESVLVEYHEGVASFDKLSYGLVDEAKVIVDDRDANRNPDAPDAIDVRIYSDTDPNGITLSLREVDNTSGIFNEKLLFTTDDTSSGNRLRVSDGDTINVKYTDNTLPQPAKLSPDGIITLDVKDIVATSVFGKHIPPTERAPASEPLLVNSFGETVSQIFTGEQILIQSEVVNMQSRKQPFAYIVQVKDTDGVTVSLSWLTVELPASDSLRVSQSWLPLTAGEYVIEVFVWEGIDKPNALSPSRIKNAQVFQ